MKLIEEIDKIEELYKKERKAVIKRREKLYQREMGRGAHVIYEIDLLDNYLEELEEAKEKLISNEIKRYAFDALKFGKTSFFD